MGGSSCLRVIRRAIAFLLVCLIFSAFLLSPLVSVNAEEIPTRVFTGTADALSILENLDFRDVRESQSFAREAIWEMGALELMKGYGSKRFGLNDRLSVEQALAVAYIAAGREAEAQAAAETLDLARAQDARITNARRMWSDGYIQLALNDGLISFAQYTDALQADQAALGEDSFRRQAPITREDMAYYLAEILNVEPVYPQTRMFNSFVDWETASPVRIPAIEALLQNRMMNGDDNGRFRPKGLLSRAEAAQILKNSSPVIFPILGYSRHRGRIEGIEIQDDQTVEASVLELTVRIRNSDGSLHTLRLRRPAQAAGMPQNERTGGIVTASLETIVSKEGVAQSSEALRTGQNIIYVANILNELPFVQVQSGTPKQIYIGKIETVNPTLREIAFQPYQELPFPDLREVDQATIQQMSNIEQARRYIVSTSARIDIEGARSPLADIEADTHAIVVLERGVVTGLSTVRLDVLQQDGVVAGIVADNNPSLGYITLYAADGYGLSSGLEDGFRGLRTYSYAKEVKVSRDGAIAAADSVIPGDSVFIKLNSDGDVWEVSAASDYAAVFGTIRSIGAGTVTVVKDEGGTRTYSVPSYIPVLRDDIPVGRSEMQVGDKIRLLVQSNAANISVAEIRLERIPIEVSQVKRGRYVWYDPLKAQVVVSNPQTFSGGRWVSDAHSGTRSYELSDKFLGATPPENADAVLYFALHKENGGEEKILALALRPNARFEQVFDDSLLSSTGDGSLFSLSGSNPMLATDAGTIIVRNGRLVPAAAIMAEDRARVSAGRDAATGRMQADVVILDTPTGADGLYVYRGRIRSIDEGANFTLESFARLDGTSWSFFNTPKTFSVRSDLTRLLSEGGVTSLRDFTQPDFVGKSVYVLTDGTFASTISDAVYGESVLKGRVEAINGNVLDAWGNTVTEPTGLSLSGTRRYNPILFSWSAVPGGEVIVPQDVIVVRNGRQSTLSEVKVGDTVRVLQTEAGGEARVLFAE